MPLKDKMIELGLENQGRDENLKALFAQHHSARQTARQNVVKRPNMHEA